MAVKLAINGFGRIGRAVFKLAMEQEGVEVVAINDLGEIGNLAYLLKYDSVYGRYGQGVEVKENFLQVGDKGVKVLNEPDPSKLPWQDMGVEVVVEATGIFTEEEQAQKHIAAGAKYVVISAPTKSEELPTIVMGVNDKDIKGKKIVSNASCTTNCAVPVAAILDGKFGVEKALLTTVHAYTSSQELVDGLSEKDPRRGRAAAINVVPSSTGAAAAAIKALPGLAGKFDGVSLRVPVPVVSISDFCFVLKKKVSVEDINETFSEAAGNPIYEQVLAVAKEPVVSSDFVGDPHSAIVDLNMTRVVDGDLVKVMAWYDNEWGYANRLVEQVMVMGG